MINIVNEYNYKFDEEKLFKYIDVINKKPTQLTEL